MKILLSGGTGFIGKKLGIELARRGHTITLLTRNISKTKLEVPFPCKLVEWNTEQERLDASAFDDVEAVINLAGTPLVEKRWNDEIKEEIIRSRVQSTQTLWKAYKKCSSKKLEVFINSSAIGFYGSRGDEELIETSSKGSDFLSVVCDRWENSLWNGDPAIRKIAVRTGAVLGRQNGALAEMLPIFKKGAGGPLGGGKQWMSWIHIEDIVGIFIHVLENKKISGPVNGVSPQPVRNKEFTKELSKAIKMPAIVPVPAFGLKVIFGEMSDVLLASQRVSSVLIQQSGYEFKFPVLGMALEHLVGFMKDGTELFESELFLQHPVRDVWDFFSSERNLEQITPHMLEFKVSGMSTPTVQKGTIIDYNLKIRGVPAKWRTEIEEWVPEKMFVDNQVRGPYKKWHHTHTFESLGNGTLMSDKVFYQLPLGAAGKLIAGPLVKSDVNKIFEFRLSKMNQLFP